MSKPSDQATLQPASEQDRHHKLGKYRLIAELARGGMGVVYLALMRGPGAFSKLLVLKQLKPELREDPVLLEMFMEEARLAACLSHPHVVQTLEAGTDGDRHYIAMEYLDGQSLHRVLTRARKRGRTVPFEWQGAVLSYALEGLAYAHAARDYDGTQLRIVHRDISPHNIFIGYDGQVKVLDFGVAKAGGSTVDTRTGVLKGKVAYMAPEQAAGAQVDARTDIFSVGVMIWEAATGRRFWSGLGNDMQILKALLRVNPGGVPERAPAELPDDLRAITTKATAFDPERRTANAAVLLEELRAVLAKRGGTMSPRAIGQFIDELFTEDRARLQAAIEEALSHYRRPFSGQFSVSQVGRVSTESEPASLTIGLAEYTPSKLPQLWQPGSTSESGSLPASTPAARFGGTPGRRRARRWMFSLGAVVGLCAVAVLAEHPLPRRRPAVAPATALAVDSPGATPSVAPPPDRAPGDKIHLVVRVSPAQARILVDRSLAFENPAVTVLPKDGARHSVRVEADGYAPQDAFFDASADTALLVTLEARKGPTRFTLPARPTAVSSAAAPVPALAPAPVNAAPSASASADPTPAATGVPQRRINPANPYSH